MKALALAPALALAAFALVAPPLAEAGHRHSRGCGHRLLATATGTAHRPTATAHRHYRPAPYYGGGYYGR